MAEGATDRAHAAQSRAHQIPVEDETDYVDVAGIFQVLRRERWIILGASLGCLVLATIVAFLLPPRFTSEVSFIPPNLNAGSSLASAFAGQLSVLGGGELLGAGKTPGDLYAGILKSRSIDSELVQRFDLKRVYGVKKESQAEAALESNTAISVDPKSTIVTVNVTDKSPALAQDLANAYMDALRETEGRLALSQSAQRRLFFERQLEKEKNDLEDAEVALKQTEERSGLIAPSGQTESEIRTIADTQAQIAVREVQLAALRDGATEQNPDVVRLHSEIDDLQGQLSRLQSGSGRDTPAAIPTSKVPEVQLEYVRKDREVKYHEALFDMLSRQYEAARLDEARDAPLVQVLDTASFPDTKSSPKRSRYMLGGLLLGLFASSAWVLLRGPLQRLRASLASSE
jgi:uncharacterized protein involved in exopolysaccharide biosynthesis